MFAAPSPALRDHSGNKPDGLVVLSLGIYCSYNLLYNHTDVLSIKSNQSICSVVSERQTQIQAEEDAITEDDLYLIQEREQAIQQLEVSY